MVALLAVDDTAGPAVDVDIAGGVVELGEELNKNEPPAGAGDSAGFDCAVKEKGDVPVAAVPKPAKPANLGCGAADGGADPDDEPAVARLGRPLIFRVASTLSSAFTKPCPGSVPSSLSPSPASLVSCLSAPLFMAGSSVDVCVGRDLS